MKVPAAGLALVALLGWACGGEARSEAGPDARALAAAQARTGTAPSATAPAAGTREAAAQRVRAPLEDAASEAGPPPEPEAVPRLESRVPEPTADASEPTTSASAQPADDPPSGPEPGDAPRPGLVPEPGQPAADPPPGELALPDEGGFTAEPEAGTVAQADPEMSADAREPERRTVPPPAPPPLVLQAGVEIPITLEAEISTRKAKAGDPFFGYVEDDILAHDGLVLIPMGARIRGRVVEVHESQAIDDPALIELAVESLITDGRSHPMLAHVVRTEIEAQSGESTGRSVAKVGVGAAAGAILGKLLGKSTESAVAGALTGAAAGTAAALAAKDGHAVLPEGSTVVLKLDVPLDLTTW